MVTSDWLSSQSSFSLSSGEFQKGDNNGYHWLSSLSHVVHCPVEIKKWLIPLTALRVLGKHQHQVVGTANFRMGIKVHDRSPLTATAEENTYWKNPCREMSLLMKTKPSAEIRDIHRPGMNKEGTSNLWARACVLEETELKLEALEGCLTDLADAGYTAWIRKK